jgi:hypothetical protein
MRKISDRERMILRAFMGKGTCTTQDARDAIHAGHSDYYLKRLIARGVVAKVGPNEYRELITEK